jgi:hypothetical protein
MNILQTILIFLNIVLVICVCVLLNKQNENFTTSSTDNLPESIKNILNIFNNISDSSGNITIPGNLIVEGENGIEFPGERYGGNGCFIRPNKDLHNVLKGITIQSPVQTYIQGNIGMQSNKTLAVPEGTITTQTITTNGNITTNGVTSNSYNNLKIVSEDDTMVISSTDPIIFRGSTYIDEWHLVKNYFSTFNGNDLLRNLYLYNKNVDKGVWTMVVTAVISYAKDGTTTSMKTWRDNFWVLYYYACVAQINAFKALITHMDTHKNDKVGKYGKTGHFYLNDKVTGGGIGLTDDNIKYIDQIHDDVWIYMVENTNDNIVPVNYDKVHSEINASIRLKVLMIYYVNENWVDYMRYYTPLSLG